MVGATATVELSTSSNPPGIFGNFKVFEGWWDVGVDGDGDGPTDGAGDILVLFHAAVAVKRERGAEYEVNKPKRPPDVTLLI
jgi:hypothetical protein